MGQHGLVDHTGHPERDPAGIDVCLSTEDDESVSKRPTGKRIPSFDRCSHVGKQVPGR